MRAIWTLRGNFSTARCGWGAADAVSRLYVEDFRTTGGLAGRSVVGRSEPARRAGGSGSGDHDLTFEIMGRDPYLKVRLIIWPTLHLRWS